MHLNKHACLFVCLTITTIQPLVVLAQATTTSSNSSLANGEPGFRPERILDDKDIFDINAWNLAQIETFLNARGRLGVIRLSDIDGIEKSAAEIIWRVANSYGINPKYLVALLQKEQSLVEDPSPTTKQLDWATGYGVCDACSKDDPSLQEFKGFASQLEWSAKQHREKYLQQLLANGATIAGHAPGRVSLIDGRAIVPDNQATAMLYSYTPHLAGNFNLWRIWQRWFGLTFPDGTVVHMRDTDRTYLIRFGQKRPFKSRAVAASMFDPQKMISVMTGALDAYAEGKTIQFANYSLVEVAGQRYLIDGQKKRLITTETVFQKLGFNADEIIMAEVADLTTYEDGSDITAATAYPTGLLAKDHKNIHWYIDGEVRHLIPHPNILKLYFRGQPARRLSARELNAFPIGEPYRLRDGELVQVLKKPDIYIIENGLRRPIASAEIFETMGWKWQNIVPLPESLLKEYPIGEALTPEHL